MKKSPSSSYAGASSFTTKRRGRSAANANVDADATCAEATTSTATRGETLLSTLLRALRLPPMDFDEISSFDIQKGKQRYLLMKRCVRKLIYVC